jgi:hypothetical protein
MNLSEFLIYYAPNCASSYLEHHLNHHPDILAIGIGNIMHLGVTLESGLWFNLTRKKSLMCLRSFVHRKRHEKSGYFYQGKAACHSSQHKINTEIL